MDGNGSRHRLGRGWVVVLVPTVLAGAVAVASAGSVPHAGTGSRRPSEQLVDAAISLLVVFLAVGAVATVVALAYLKRVAASSSNAPPPRRGVTRSLAVITSGLALVIAALLIARSREESRADGGLLPGLGGGNGDATTPGAAYEPEFSVWPVVAVAVLGAVAVVAVLLERRARRTALPRPAWREEEVLADVLDETLDDLRDEPDARRAVVLAYARMERALRAAGLGRRPAEAPDEYLERIVASLELSAHTVGRLTALFTWARFSGHYVDPAMKEQAIDTLEAARTELRANAARREVEAQAEAALRLREAGT